MMTSTWHSMHASEFIKLHRLKDASRMAHARRCWLHSMGWCLEAQLRLHAQLCQRQLPQALLSLRHHRRADSQLIGAFRSHPGPIGQLRSGTPCLYYSPPPQQPWLPAPDAAYETVTPAALERQRVAIWTLTASASLPASLLAELDGLVLAGSGSGRCGCCKRMPGMVPAGPPSLELCRGCVLCRGSSTCVHSPQTRPISFITCSVPQALIDQLSLAWTARLPIIVCSRCGVGANCDDWLYRGSRAKYASRGFVLDKGYEHLNPLQARSLLVLRLAAFGHA